MVRVIKLFSFFKSEKVDAFIAAPFCRGCTSNFLASYAARTEESNSFCDSFKEISIKGKNLHLRVSFPFKLPNSAAIIFRSGRYSTLARKYASVSVLEVEEFM